MPKNTLFEQFQIIGPKLKPQKQIPNHFSRSELCSTIFSEAEPRGLILINAPAGSGKSTFMSELYDRSKSLSRESYWLSLDEDDNELAIFAKYFIASTASFDNKVAARELSLLHSNVSRDYTTLLNSTLSRLISSDKQISIFLDDFQFITNDEIIRFLDKFISHCPSNIQLVISSRVRPTIDVEKVKLAGLLTEVTQEELNLDASQITDFLKNGHSIECTRESAELLKTTTEGWVAGIQLAAIAVSKSGEEFSDFIQTYTGSNKSLSEYLFNTVLQRLSPDIREFLLLTSPLIRFSAELCNYVTSTENSYLILDFLEGNNIFIISQDENREWFRYHHLFSDFLKSELLRKNSTKYKEVCSRAAEWSDNEGYITEAIQYYLATDTYERAAELIVKRAPELALYKGDHHTILDWMRRLPGDYHTNNPKILLNHAWSCAFSRDPSKAIDLCETVYKGLNDSSAFLWSITEREAEEYYWLAKATESIAVVCDEQVNRSLEICISSLSKVPDHEAFPISAMNNCAAYAYLAIRDYEKCIYHANEGYISSLASGSNYASVWALFVSSLAHVRTGNLEVAHQEAVKSSKISGPSRDSTIYLHVLSESLQKEVDIQRCNFDDTKYHAADTSFISLYGPAEPLLIVIRNEARLLMWNKNTSEALDLLHRGQEIALSTNQKRLYISLISEEIELNLSQGFTLDAERTLKRSKYFKFIQDNTSEEFNLTYRILEDLTFCRLSNARESYELTIQKCDLLLQCLKDNSYADGPDLITTLVLKSVALWGSGEFNESTDLFEDAVNIALKHWYAYPIVVCGPAILPITEQLLGKNLANKAGAGTPHEFINHIQHTLAPDYRSKFDNDLSSHANGFNEALSSREAGILKLLAAGLSNGEIADQASLSIATVKWHLHNIYQKLGVKSRTAAAALARERGIV
ncbi:LuxR C-terminal-related transcriptional regulator [Spongiibacter marinus]|uniref:LuxR C-terminal-related transcriptional regulator n=1 Tax=Spongiibacter marinus TaxID=354246 RepID=UPI00040BD12E|nr:LuxR C-terminal-related transcriptional regulator [Spongiibacter marinus]